MRDADTGRHDLARIVAGVGERRPDHEPADRQCGEPQHDGRGDERRAGETDLADAGHSHAGDPQHHERWEYQTHVQAGDLGVRSGALHPRVQEQRPERDDRRHQVHEVENPVEVVVLGDKDGKHGRTIATGAG